MYSITISENIICTLVQQLSDLIKYHPESYALQYLLEQKESLIPPPENSQYSQSRAEDSEEQKQENIL
jgi:hypothetical protein